MHYCMVVMHLIIPRVQYALHVQALTVKLHTSQSPGGGGGGGGGSGRGRGCISIV